MEQRRFGQMPTLETRADAEATVDKQMRYRQIIECLTGNEMTAKEIAVEMWRKGYIPTSERNFTSPRLTELMDKGIVEPIGKKKCLWTGKTVTVWSMREA